LQRWSIPVRRLTAEEIRQAACGCEGVVVSDGAVRFLRLPEPLAERYRADEASRIRLECPSGVRLRFRSDTRRIRIGIRYGAAARPLYRGALLVDGSPAGTFGPDEAAESWEGTQPVPAADEGALLELWMPHLVRADLAFLEIDAGSAFEPAPPTGPRWLALGDSITQGMTAPLPTETWVARTARQLGLDVRDGGIGGGKLESFVAEADLTWPYDVLTVAFGTNDFNVGIPPAEYAANARRLAARQTSAHPRARILLIAPTPWVGRVEPNRSGFRLPDYRDALAAVARELDRCCFVDGGCLVPDEPRYFVDNVHPNAEGMARIAESLAEPMRQALASLRTQETGR